MDRLARHQTQLKYTQTEEEQGAEIQRGRGRLFDGQDVFASVVPTVTSRRGHVTW